VDGHIVSESKGGPLLRRAAHPGDNI
jgi:hypothetical protein